MRPDSTGRLRSLFLPEGPPAPPEKLRIWVGEDDVANADFLDQAIGRPGIAEVRCFLDGRRLWAALTEERTGPGADSPWPDVLLLDPHLPVISGSEILVRLEVPLASRVFLLMDDLHEGDQLAALWPEVDAFFVRPLSPAHVAEILRHFRPAGRGR